VRPHRGHAGGGFIDLNSREVPIRHLSRTNRAEDLAGIAVAWKDGRSILMEQVATASFAAGLKRGDTGRNRLPAVVISIQKQVAAGNKLDAKGLKLAKGARVVAAPVTPAAKAITVRFTVK
jgi:HME family heavy-metal exporter